jgi:hypothetical protein
MCLHNEGETRTPSDFLRQPRCRDCRLDTGFDQVGAASDLIDTRYAEAGGNLDVGCRGIAEVVGDRGR